MNHPEKSLSAPRQKRKSKLVALVQRLKSTMTFTKPVKLKRSLQLQPSKLASGLFKCFPPSSTPTMKNCLVKFPGLNFYTACAQPGFRSKSNMDRLGYLHRQMPPQDL